MSPKDKAFSIGRRKMSEETNIIEIVRQLRFARKAMSILLSKATIQKIVEFSRYRTIRVDPNPEKWLKEEESDNEFSLSCFE